MYEHLYKIYPDVLGIDNITIINMDTDSIFCKLKNINHEQYKKILEKYKHYFSKEIGDMVPDYIDNLIKEMICLCSKCYGHINKNNIEHNKNRNKNEIIHTKSIGNNYKNKYIDYMMFKKRYLKM